MVCVHIRYCVQTSKHVRTFLLQVMGQNFALNMASHGFNVSVCNRSPEKVDATVERAKSEGDLPLKGYKDPKEFVESLSKPRKIILLVQAGKAVDSTITVLSEFMEASLPLIGLSTTIQELVANVYCCTDYALAVVRCCC